MPPTEDTGNVTQQFEAVSLESHRESLSAPASPDTDLAPEQDQRTEAKIQDDQGPAMALPQQLDAEEGNKARQPKKSVGFAPEIDLQDYHHELKQKAEERAKDNIFQKIPPELAYLQKKGEGPKPIFSKQANHSRKTSGTSTILGDLKLLHVKDISVQNKQTELNFNFPTFELPIPASALIVNVHYAALNSFDLAKVNKYFYNLSDTKIGLGHAFAGTIIDIGASCDPAFAKGDLVFGCVSPTGRKGSLSSALILYPTKDFIVKIDDSTLDRLEALDVHLDVEHHDQYDVDSNSDSDSLPEAVTESVSNSANASAAKGSVKGRRKGNSFPVESKMPALAKSTVFPVLYCKAKQVLSHNKFVDKRANVLINGADTSLGLTLIQMLNSSLYSHLEELNLVLVCRESRLKEMRSIIEYFTTGKYFNASCSKNLQAVSFDVQNEDIVLAGEKIPIQYKKSEILAMEILDAMFARTENITEENINSFKLDLIVDIIGSKQCLQKTSIKWDRLAMLAFPVQRKMANSLTLKNLIKANVKEQFLIKILKPKAQGSAFVSLCKFSLRLPSYSIDELIDYSTQTNEASVFNPWSMNWSGKMANSLLLAYNFFDEINLRIKTEWLQEGLKLMLNDELKFNVDAYDDWRNDYRHYIKGLKKQDGEVVFKIEEF